jgi:glucose/arabinose dehydrogenase
MNRIICLVGVFLSAAVATAGEGTLPAPRVTGLKNPQGIVVGGDGRVYVSVAGEIGKDGDGAVMVIEQGKAVPFATGLDDPRGLAAYQQWLFVADRNRIWRIDNRGKATLFAGAGAFPSSPMLLSGLVADPESGLLYVAAAGEPASRDDAKTAALYRVSPQGKVSTVADAKSWPGLRLPTGVQLDGASHLVITDPLTGELQRIKLADRTTEKLAEQLGGAQALAWDRHGRLYVSAKTGTIWGIARPGDKPVQLASGFKDPASLCLDPGGRAILVADASAGTITALPTTIPRVEVDESPLPLESALAFPNLKWAGWSAESATGAVTALRPLLLTHAGDGSNRIFVATEHGVIHVFANDQKAAQTQVFLDLQDRVKYNDNENEEGFLGLAFHPNYKNNGELFVFYTTKKARRTNILSRFHVSRDDPNRADLASEEEILRVARPFWNHDGGTLCFGPDGYLYVALGDGGAANDPFGNGQNLKTLLGKVLRLDVDHKDASKNYAVPKDNPFVTVKDARPEIWAYGLRNVWRMAFDRPTGKLWAADVGQNLYEEIDLLTAGGNYGWNRREGLHPFGAKGSGPRPEYIEPIWEYHHDTGKSITGGLVYRGSRLPQLAGAYVYGDYVSGKIWALRYSDATKRVVANHPIRDRGVPIMSFGEDEQGEIYYMTYTTSGQGIYWFVPEANGKTKSLK